VHRSVAVGNHPDSEYIFELCRTSHDGREPFISLLQAVAVELKRTGHATQYANRDEIYPKVFHPLDNDEYSKPDYDPDSGTDTYAITLNTDSVERMSSLLVQRRYPHYHETLRLLVKCSAGSIKNRELLLKSSELEVAVLRELQSGSQAGTCYNALKLIELGAVMPKGASLAVVRILLLFSGLKPSGYKRMRSQAIENTALKAMNVLMSTMSREELRKVMRVIESEFSVKLGEILLRKVQAIGSRSSAQLDGYGKLPYETNLNVQNVI